MDTNKSATHESQSNPLAIVVTSKVFEQRLVRERVKHFPESHLRGRWSRQLRRRVKLYEVGIHVFLD